jgi:hypothetical protein
MSKISSGILGGFSGKVGNVVGAKWKGIDTMKIKPSNIRNPKTPRQLDQRTRFSTIIGFLKPMAEFIRVSFRPYAKKMTQFNAAMSYNLQHAITGTYPNYSVDFSKALVSRGSLTEAINGAATSPSKGNVVFTWSDNTGSGSALSSDKAMLLAYNPSKQQAVSNITNVERDTATATLTVPDDFSGNLIHLYLSFANAEGSKVSNSIYCGSVTVSSTVI